MSEFVNTIDVLGDDAVMDSIIDRSITEFKDDKITVVGNSAFRKCDSLTVVDLPNVETIDSDAFTECTLLEECNIPRVKKLTGSCFANVKSLESLYMPELTSMGSYIFQGTLGCTKNIICPKCASFGIQAISHSGITVLDIHVKTDFAANSLPTLTALILRSTDGVSTLGNVNALDNMIKGGAGYIYVPASMIGAFKTATNWSTYPDLFRALEDYTVDGTITGELDESKI